MINYEINRLINFGLQKRLISHEDVIYSTNMLLGLLKLNDFNAIEVNERLETPTPILEKILDYAVEKRIIENTVLERDLFDTHIMNCLMPRPSEVIAKFKKFYSDSPESATKYYYELSIASNYIRKARIDKNIVWKTATEYENLDITINLSKPEKDPRDIAKAKLIKSTSYPKCLLCKENEGFFGSINHPARQTHRIIPLELNDENYFMQYSPYGYYNEHCIIFNANHVPMKINRRAFMNLLSFVDVLPHYFAGSNADLPIVGGLILSHDHYQGGHYTFAMEKAEVEKIYKIKGFENVSVGRVKWPMSVLRLDGVNKEEVVNLADHILTAWRNYNDESAEILSHTGNEMHNTITPIARKKDGKYELDLVLRNNRTSKEHPLGIFHPHSEVHHIKKENIGLIEVMGLAVLPARLKNELAILKEDLVNGVKDISSDERVSSHADWYKMIVEKYNDIKESNAEDILKVEVGLVFSTVLSHAGVYKRNEKGMVAFDRFVEAL